MNFTIFAIGKPKLPFTRDGVEEYTKRLGAWRSVEVEFLKASTQREAQSALLLERSKGMFRILLDERGEMLSSRAFAGKLLDWERAGTKRIAFLIGGADGHTESLRREADWIWSLSPLTLQHELALVVLCEQLYRAASIQAGGPYHRD